MNEYELRNSFIEYVSKNSNAINQYLFHWNLKLSRGVPISKEFLYDLFGKSLESEYQKELWVVNHNGKSNVVSAALLVNEENAFQTMFSYLLDRDGEVTTFQLGEEQDLIDCVYERRR